MISNKIKVHCNKPYREVAVFIKVSEFIKMKLLLAFMYCLTVQIVFYFVLILILLLLFSFSFKSDLTFIIF